MTAYAGEQQTTALDGERWLDIGGTMASSSAAALAKRWREGSFVEVANELTAELEAGRSTKADAVFNNLYRKGVPSDVPGQDILGMMLDTVLYGRFDKPPPVTSGSSSDPPPRSAALFAIPVWCQPGLTLSSEDSIAVTEAMLDAGLLVEGELPYTMPHLYTHAVLRSMTRVERRRLVSLYKNKEAGLSRWVPPSSGSPEGAIDLRFLLFLEDAPGSQTMRMRTPALPARDCAAWSRAVTSRINGIRRIHPPTFFDTAVRAHEVFRLLFELEDELDAIAAQSPPREVELDVDGRMLVASITTEDAQQTSRVLRHAELGRHLYLDLFFVFARHAPSVTFSQRHNDVLD